MAACLALCCTVLLAYVPVLVPEQTDPVKMPGVMDSVKTENLLATESPQDTIEKEQDAPEEMIWKASYYGSRFHGRYTASGEVFDENKMTCAHKTLKFGTMLKVTSIASGKSVIVRVNDRGPFIKGRQLDLSYGAAKHIGMLKAGVATVKVIILKQE